MTNEERLDERRERNEDKGKKYIGLRREIRKFLGYILYFIGG